MAVPLGPWAALRVCQGAIDRKTILRQGRGREPFE